MTDASDPWVRPHGSGVRITVRVTARASQSKLDGVRDGVLRVRLAAPPVEGAANAELIRTLAEALDVPRSAIQISSGLRSRTKTVDVTGLTPAQVIDVT